jgi:pyridoxal phosphate-dependent aminotransferase EpsN
MKKLRKRLYLSPPHMGGAEIGIIHNVFAGNWIAPLGPFVTQFEKRFCKLIGSPHAAAMSSGTAALHLALRLIGVKKGDDVFCPSFTFCASANPIVYQGARPGFIDSEPNSWNMDPSLLEKELRRSARIGKLPKAVIVVHLYGQCADMDPILECCNRYGVPIIEDAAEALGACYNGKQAGSFGEMAIFSFNGNKLITTAGGGMLVSKENKLVEKARFLASQARDPAPYYQHSELGYNYRMSSVLAAIGLGQLKVVRKRIAQKRALFSAYKNYLKDVPGISFMPEPSWSCGNRWLTCILVDPDRFGHSADAIRKKLETCNIESRRLWKPLHL